LPVINANSSACDEASRNKFVFIVLNDGHASLLGYTVDGTHPRAVRYGSSSSKILCEQNSGSMPLISVSFQAIAFFHVLRTLMRAVFALKLRSFAMMTGNFPLSLRNAYS
nr:hypothetical protein [Tanacetum cinerariifolium]